MLVAVDTGGTKTLVAVFQANGTILTSTKFPTPHDENEYLAELSRTITDISSGHTIDGISIASPGIIRDGVIEWAGGNLAWRNFPLIDRLSAHFPDTPIILDNDANLGGLGETRLLEVIPESSLYITISTGIGTGVITNGRVDPGLRYSEAGHAGIEFDGMLRSWESFASGKAIYETYGKFGKDIHDKKIWYQIADRISRGILILVPIMQPQIIIIGGSMGTHFAKYEKVLLDILKERLPDHITCPPIIQAQHPEQAVVYGCYFNALDELTPQTT